MPFFEALAERSSDFSVLLMAKSHASRSWTLPDAKFPIHVLPGLHYTPPGWYEPLHLNYGVAKALRRLRPDVILNGCYTLASVAAYSYCRRAHVHHVPWGELTLKDGAETSRLRRQLRRWLISGSSGCIASSSLSRDAFAHYGMPMERILLATMPVQTDFFATAAAAARASGEAAATRALYGSPLLLAAGQLTDRKGLPELLDAMRIVQQHSPRATLVVAGDGPQLKAYQQRATQLGLDVRFPGFLSPAALARLFAAADAFVFPTRFDTFGAVIPESMAASVILVASVHAAATQDFVVDGESGFIVNPDDPQQLAVGILRALNMPNAMREAMSVRASARVSSLSFAASADAVMQFLQQLPSQGRRVARSAQSRSGDESKSA
jgi:glycosyltransferase involved in cell wall biosynthesis